MRLFGGATLLLSVFRSPGGFAFQIQLFLSFRGHRALPSRSPLGFALDWPGISKNRAGWRAVAASTNLTLGQDIGKEQPEDAAALFAARLDLRL